MTDPPAFLSFPDLGDVRKDKPSAPASASVSVSASASATPPPAVVPSFSSFPDIDFGASKSKRRLEEKEEERREKKDKRARERSRDRERERERAGERGKEKEDNGKERGRERGKERDRERERSRRDRDDGRRERERDSERDRHRDRDRERERERDRSRDRDRDREKERERDRDRERDKDRRRRDKDKDRDDDRRKDRERNRDRERDRPRERDRDERRKEIEDRRERERRKAAELAEGEKRVREDDGGAWYESSAKPKAGYEAPFDPTSASVAFVDTVGDKDVIRYGATSSFSAPRYRRDKGGRILGLSNGLRIVYSSERTQKGVEVAPLGRPYIPRYSSPVIDGTASRHLARILLRPSQDSSDLTESFTPFDIPRLKDREDADDLPAYRSIAKEDSDEEELEAIQAALGKVSTLEEDIRNRTAEYEKHLRDYPGDIDKWLEYSKLHLQLHSEASVSSATVDPAKQPTNRANAEVTLSILSRALEHQPNFSSTELHIAYLRTAEVFWPTNKVTERWQNVIRTLGDRGASEEDMMGLYLGYIEWREGQGIGQTAQGSTGGVDEVVDVYLDCLYKLNTGRVRDQEAREENQVYLLLRACLFLKQAGFNERALAVFQALLEVTFFKPAHLRQPAPPFDREAWFRGVLEEFEDFWDSEAPRLGEPDAQGWAAAHSSRTPVKLFSNPVPEPYVSTSSDPYARWLEAEKHAHKSFKLPGRVTDLDTPDDDPFHFVIFSDVRPFLFPIQTPGARLQLIYAFFSFLGLPFSPPDVPTSSASSTDPHLRWSIGENDMLRASFWPPKPSTKRLMWQTVGGEPMEPEQPRALGSPFACPVKSWMADRGTLFAHHWFRDIDRVDLEHVNVDYARNVLAMLRPLVPDPSFVLSTFAFEAALSPKAAIKLAKSILSADRDNFALWDGYARLERQRGKVDAARQVYVTAIQAAAQRTSSDDLRLDENDLWTAWAAMEFEEGEEERCLEVLVMAASGSRDGLEQCTAPGYVPSRPSAIALLKAKQHYVTRIAECLPLATMYIVLTDGIEAARDKLLDIIDGLPKGHPQAEETYQLLTKTIFTYSSRHSIPASIARGVLEQALDAFPNNTAFLSLYLWGETGGRVYGRVHRLVTKLTGEKAGAVSLMWAVWAEAVSAGTMFWFGGAERVRRALDRAINSDLGKKSPTLWKLYVEFEMHQGKPASAKALVYRALAANGGCKDLYLLPFSPLLREHFTSRELRALGELMAERGIRMRVQTEMFWEDVDTEDEDEDDEDEMDPGDYEYGMLRDREELKPY